MLLALLIGLVFPLPPIELHGRVRPLGLARLVLRLLADVVTSSFAVVRLAFRFGTAPRSAIIRVQLRSRSDLYLTQTAELVSLVPGTIVVEARRSTSTLYLHVLDTVSDADLERAAARRAGRRSPGDSRLRVDSKRLRSSAIRRPEPVDTRRACRRAGRWLIS